MPAILANIRNFLYTTDYPIDQVVYMASGSFSATGGGAGTNHQFAHELLFEPLIVGTWSLDADFSTSREGGFFGFEGTDPTTVYNTFYANDTNVTVSCINPGSTATIYYRVYGFMPSNVNEDVDFTSVIADIFQSNTDYNYTKLLYNDIAEAEATTIITHDLGYRPQVMAWLANASIYGSTMIVDMGYVKVGTTTVTLLHPSNDIHYRIYGDGQV